MDPTSYNSGMASALMNTAAPLTGALTDPFSANPNFVNPQYVTPEQAQSMRTYGAQLMKQPTSIHRPIQGVAEMVDAALGGNMQFQADQATQAQQAQLQAAYARGAATSLGAGGLPAGGAPAPSQSAAPAASDTSPGFNSAVNRTLGFEGGLNPSDTNGTPSNMGINQAANPGVDVSSLTPDQAKGIYKSNYWDSIGADNMSPPLARVAFDTAVIAGPAKAQELVAQSGGDPNKLLDLRQQFQNGLIQADPQKYGKYAQAWQNRNDGLRSDVSAMSQPQPQAGAAQAIGSAAPQGQMPSSAMAFSGAPQAAPQQAAPMAPTLPTNQQAMGRALMGGGQGPFTPQDAALLAQSPMASESSRAMANALVNPQVTKDSYQNQYYQRPGAPAVPVPGMKPGVIQVPVHVGNVATSALVSAPPGPGGAPTSTLALPGAGAPGAQSSSTGPNTNPAPMLGSLGALSQQSNALDTQNAAQRAAGEGGAAQYVHDQAAGANYNRTIFPLTQAIPALEALGKTGTGPGTAQLNEIKSFLQSAGIPGLDASKIQNFDEAQKYLTDYVRQTGSSGTNDQLAAAFAGNPSVNIGNAAAVDVAKSALALQRMQQAKLLSADATHPELYGAHATQFATQQDPRAYGVDLMTPEASKNLNASLPKGSPQRARFLQSLAIAKSTGVLPPLSAH